MRILRFPQLRPEKGIPYSRQHLHNLENTEPPLFAKRVELGPNRIGWVEFEIDAWNAEKAIARDVCDREETMIDLIVNNIRKIGLSDFSIEYSDEFAAASLLRMFNSHEQILRIANRIGERLGNPRVTAKLKKALSKWGVSKDTIDAQEADAA